MRQDGADRYHVKRAAGLSPVRTDGSQCDPETDRQAAAAEEWAATYSGERYNDTLTLRGDGGHDFVYRGWTVEVSWLGFVKGTTIPRRKGHLIVNPDEPHRWADLYCVVEGSIEHDFLFHGWAWHYALIGAPQQDFGHGRKFALPTGQLGTAAAWHVIYPKPRTKLLPPRWSYCATWPADRWWMNLRDALVVIQLWVQAGQMRAKWQKD